MLDRLFKRRPAKRAAERLYAGVATQARRPVFYTDLDVPDRIDARFELYTLHVLLLSQRLRDEGKAGADAAQDLFDVYVSALDHTLRELGVGDISVAKKMRRLGEALYGRMTAYDEAIRANDADRLAASLARNVHEADAPSSAAHALADYVFATRRALAAQSFEAVMDQPAWLEPGPVSA